MVRMSTPQPIVTDRMFQALGDERRRKVLQYLQTHGDAPIPLQTLAENLSQPAGDASDVKTLTIELHHHHLPKLDEAGLLDYDVEARTVTADGGSLIGDLLGSIEDTYPG